MSRAKKCAQKLAITGRPVILTTLDALTTHVNAPPPDGQ
jgi:hypothetical protein